MGLAPADWLAAWKRDELEDTAENMGLLVRVAGIRAMAADEHPFDEITARQGTPASR